MSRTRGRGKVAAIVTALTLVLAACGGSAEDSPAGGDGTQEALDAALREGGTITYWSWTPQAEDQVAAFEKKYPNVTVNLVNAGTGNDHYTKLQNAIKSGSGGPDVAQIEYQALPQFALTDALVDLGQYGLRALEQDYTASTWAAVNVGDGLYGLPQDSGPMALFYNKEVFDTHGIEVPKTWDDYVEAAKKLHAADPAKYITSDGGDAGFTTSLIWQAGGRPFSSDGTSVSINLQDAGSKKWATMWNELVENRLLASMTSWSDEWYRALGNGTIATLISGAWLPGILESSVPDTAGKWRAAPIPTYDGGQPVTAEHGGSTQSVLKQSDNPELAAAFVRWLNHEGGVQPLIEGGGFPATKTELESAAFRDKSNEYFGGQKVNQVLTEAAGTVGKGWSYLPYQLYANTIYADTVGRAYLDHSDLNRGLTDWQRALTQYGTQQGFTVNAG